MPGHRRYDWHERIRALEREYLAARAAAVAFLTEVGAGRGTLPPDVKLADVRAMAANLEGTFLVRLYAGFEAGLRTFWEAVRDTKAIKARDLIDGVGATCGASDAETANAHPVREARNRLVHEGAKPGDALPLETARRHLARFFSRLPESW